MEKEYGYQKNPGESRGPKEEREETNPAIGAALETFEDSISSGNDPETAKSKALIRFNSVGASLTNSAEENQMAFDELQKELESRMIREKEKNKETPSLEKVLKMAETAWKKAFLETEKDREISAYSEVVAADAAFRVLDEFDLDEKTKKEYADKISDLIASIEEPTDGKEQPELPKEETPQDIAQRLSRMSPPEAANEFAKLPENIQADVAYRIATMDMETTPPPPPDKKEPAKGSEPKIETESKEKKTPEEIKLEQDLKQFNITPEQISEIEDFNILTPGQKLLVMENLKQLTLGRIQEEATDKYKTQTAQAGRLGRMWQNISKKYQIAKLGKSTASEIISGGMETHRDVLEKLITGAVSGPDAKIAADGNLEVQYFSPEKTVYDSVYNEHKLDKKITGEFNNAAAEFRRMPYEWSIATATKQQKNQFDQTKEKYELAKKELLNDISEKGGEFVANELITDAEKQIKLNQFINSNPEIEKELQNIESQQAWLEFLKSAATERGLTFAAGFATRTFTISALGLIGTPVVAAVVAGVMAAGGFTGGLRAHQRAQETLREEQKTKREGAEKIREATKEFKETKTISELVKAETLTIGIANLLDKIREAKSENDIESVKKINGQLAYLVEYASAKIANGSVNFGAPKEKLFNQQFLTSKIAEAGVEMQDQKLEGEMLAKLENILGKQETRRTKEEKSFVNKKIITGALISAGLAAAGAITREIAGEYFGWRGSADWKNKEILKNWAKETIEPEIGIDSSNGVDQDEVKKLIAEIKKYPTEEYVESIKSAYEKESVVGTDKTVGEMIDEALKEEASKTNAPENLPIETAPIDEASPSPIETSPVPTETDAEPLSKLEQQKEFVNPILGDRDSIWRSTEDTFRIYRDKLGYNSERDGDDVNKWARKKTAEVMNELAEKMEKGKLPDIVHDNDKIIISIGEDGNPHLRFEENSGLKAEYFEEPKGGTIPAQEKPDHPENESLGEQKEPATQIQDEETPTLPRDNLPTNIDLSEPQILNVPEENRWEYEKADSLSFDKFRDAYEIIPADGDRSGVVKQYILQPELKNGLLGFRGNREKLDAFVRMFDGNWEKIKDASALGKSVEEFNGEVIKDTNLLITGKFNEAISDSSAKIDELIDSTFPVESKTGEIFYAHIKGDGSWRVFKADENIGTAKTDKMKMIERDKLFGKDEKFSWQDVRKFLGFKENEIKTEPTKVPEPMSEQIAPKGEKFVPPEEGANKKG